MVITFLFVVLLKVTVELGKQSVNIVVISPGWTPGTAIAKSKQRSNIKVTALLS